MQRALYRTVWCMVRPAGRDLMFFIEANTKIQQEGHELRDGTLCTETADESASPSRRRSKRK